MALVVGTRLGRYEIVGLLGSGGMGAVYRARDARLGRDVAVKVIADEVVADPERLRRFELEAQTLATLNHPNVLAVYDVGISDGVPYLVTELLDGGSLRAHVGTLLPRRALEFAIAIVSGLAAAHARGIVHRDLKPENVVVTGEGLVKVIDFGLATLRDVSTSIDIVSAGAPNARASAADTHPRLATASGVVLGTVGYMAPEQVRGQRADNRADIFAFGAVLFELLTGRRAFGGATPADTMSAILNTEVVVPADATVGIPPLVQQVMLRCLEKDPSGRFQSTSDLLFALKVAAGSASTTSAVTVPSSGPGRRWLTRYLWPGIALVVIAALLATVLLRRVPGSGPSMPVVSFDVPLPPGMRWTQPPLFAISPDSSRLALLAFDRRGERRLLMRTLKDPLIRDVTAAIGGLAITWGGDGESVLYVTSHEVYRVNIADGYASQVATVPCLVAPGSVHMTSDSALGIVFSCNGTSGLWVVSPQSGTARQLTSASGNEGDLFHSWPDVLPGSRGVLYTRRAAEMARDVTVFDPLDATGAQVVGPAQALYSGGLLLFPRGDAFLAQPFDLQRGQLTGEARPIGIAAFRSGRSAQIAVNKVGTLVAITAAPDARTQFSFTDRRGRENTTVGPPGAYGAFDITPKGDKIVVSGNGSSSLFLLEPGKPVAARLTFDDQLDTDPNIADGGRLFFARRYGRAPGLYETSLDGGTERRFETAEVASVDDVSDDGQLVVFRKATAAVDVFISRIDTLKSVLALHSNTAADQVHLSPDGQWFAYNAAGETGQQEVYVVERRNPANRVQISTSGGAQATWRADGRELFFLGLDGMLNSVSFAAVDGVVKRAAPQPLFDTSLRDVSPNQEQYRVTADGQRFVLRLPISSDAPPALRVVLNWPGLLNR